MQRKSLTSLFNTPVLTERLVVRRLLARDVDAFHAAMAENDFEMERFFTMPPGVGKEKEKIRDYIFPHMNRFRRTCNIHYLGIFKGGNPDNLLGMVACSYDRQNNVRAGYFIKPSERRHGYASEMYTGIMQAIKTYTGQTRMYAEVLPENKSSLRMLMSIGLTPVGMRVGTINKNEKRCMIALTKAF